MPATRAACGCDWQFVAPADGSVRYRGYGSRGLVVDDPVDGPAMVVLEPSTTTSGSRYRIAHGDLAEITGDLPIPVSVPIVVGPYLMLPTTDGAVAVDTRDAAAPPVTLDRRPPAGVTDPYGENEIGLTRTGVVAVDGPTVSSTDWAATAPRWSLDTDILDTGAVVGEDSIAVITAVERTNPMDEGDSRISDTRDRRVSVLDPDTGAVLAQVRTHWKPRVTAVSGAALVLDSEELLWLGPTPAASS